MTAMKDDFYHGGLTDDEVRKSREKYGVNLLTPPKRPSLWKLYLEKFEDPVDQGTFSCCTIFFDHLDRRE